MVVGIFLAQCANVVVPEATEQAMRYYNSGNILWLIRQAWGVLLPFLFLITGLSGKLGFLAERWGRKWFFSIVLYLLLFVPLYALLNFPLDFYSGYIREHEYGFSTQTFARWWDHYLKELLIAIIGSLSFIWIFYLLLKKSPRRWWIYSSIVSMTLTFFVAFIQPIWIDPLFNRYGPMQNKQLEGQILHLADRAGISNGRVFEVDKSQDTKTVNAYVTGLGSSNRIVLWDTAIKGLTEEELLFVMGHEMGHYVLHHIWWQFLYLCVSSFITLYLVYKIGTYVVFRYGQRFGFSHLYRIASLPLFLLITHFLAFFSAPASNLVSRWMEREADRFGLEITQSNQAAAEAFVVLQQENLGNPRPGALYKIWRSTHPPLKERVDFCNTYCPWSEGKPLKYQSYFKE